MGKRVIFTGGSGKAGSWAIKELLKHGHTVLNIDRSALLDVPVHTLHCDITDGAQVYSAFSTQLAESEPLEVGIPSPPDAIIHFAGWARPLLASDRSTFCDNVLGFHNVLEAASKLGVKKIILASSVTVYGVSYAQGPRKYSSFPIDEELEVNPTDPYALSKLVGETMARSFAARYNIDIYCLRIGRVISPDEYNQAFESYVTKPHMWAVHGWSYIDARDLGQICHRALETDNLGFQIFNATNNMITNRNPTRKFLTELYPDALFSREMEEFEAPMSNKKIRDKLKFVEEHPWTRYFSGVR